MSISDRDFASDDLMLEGVDVPTLSVFLFTTAIYCLALMEYAKGAGSICMDSFCGSWLWGISMEFQVTLIGFTRFKLFGLGVVDHMN
ncbi:hypothetical protein TorRG33x02_329520 [Trema orientale]|uniref:Transmembrane protein n=1 Tax=Trema orientale TaxID=63057 RepID=A0A2P5B8F7_TREOI|nr:hypothetical protein TorRG33x02_329520 [Trema orientale]